MAKKPVPLPKHPSQDPRFAPFLKGVPQGWGDAAAYNQRRKDPNWGPQEGDDQVAPVTTTPGRSYVDGKIQPITVPSESQSGAPSAILMNEGVDTRSGANGSAGTSTGMFGSQSPLGSTIDEDNRYLLRSGAVLLR